MIQLEIEQDIPREWIHAMHTLHFMRMMHTFTRGWEETEFFIVLAQLDKNFEMTKKLTEVNSLKMVPFFSSLYTIYVIFQMYQAEELQFFDLDTEMKIRLFLRTLCWEVCGTNYGLRAVRLLYFWIIMNY